MKTFNVVELFSGIGSQAKALKNIGSDIRILNTCEWNFHACAAYAMIHNGGIPDVTFEGTKKDLIDFFIEEGISNNGKEAMNEAALITLQEDALRRVYSAIRSTNNLVDISRVPGEELDPNIDILTYSFPCQDLSNVGAFHGYQKGIDRDANNRSCLLWQVERILFERKNQDLYLPHFLLMENVPALNSSRHKKNFEEWQRQLNSLGYYNKQYLLNAKDFGVPQNRERLFMISILTDNDSDIENDIENYFKAHDLESESYRKSLGIKKRPLSDFLKTDYSNPKYYKEALECQPNNTVSRRKIWEENIQLTDDTGRINNSLVTSTLTTKQDRHPNSGNLWIDFNNGKANFRYLTPRECFLLMGFDEYDYDRVVEGNFALKAKSKIFTRDNLIKMAGNSIAVNVLERVFEQIVALDRQLFI